MKQLREYQHRAVASVFSQWETAQSTLAVMATGCGKTVCFSEIIRQVHPQRALVLCHREELVWQAMKHIRATGLDVSIEMADLTARTELWDTSVIVSTIQTQIAGNKGKGRMALFDPNNFGLLIVDECHHATSKTWKKTIAYYQQNPELKVLGVTATPDRADKQALGQVFETVAFEYDILDAVHDGFLVPIQQQMVTIEGLDYSKVRTTCGDLNGVDLAAVMESEKNMQGVADASMQIIGDKKALVFTASVKQAEMLSEIFNRHKENISGWACGATPKDQRRWLLEEFAEGRKQIVVNCGLFGEGFDEPGVEIVVQARPTKSRSLYAQQIGRGTRPLPGVVDGLATPDERKTAISASAKPNLIVVDFVGNAGKHKLITTADILGGKVSQDAIDLAVQKAKKTGLPVDMAKAVEEEQKAIHQKIEAAKQREAARKAHLVAKAKFKTQSVDPFDVFGLKPKKSTDWYDRGKSLSPKQMDTLRRNGIDPNQYSYSQAKQLFLGIVDRLNRGLPTLKQCRILRKRGVETDGITFTQANEKIAEIRQREGWKDTQRNAPRTSPAPQAPAPRTQELNAPPEPPWMKDLF